MAANTHLHSELTWSLQDERWALLQRVAASAPFQKSNRLRELLLYLGERSLRQPDVPIREHEIGVGLFGRDPNYDTSQDTLVRVQASQLRKKLQQYFLEEGKDESILIDLPKGSYTLHFVGRGSAVDVMAVEPESSPRRGAGNHGLAYFLSEADD